MPHPLALAHFFSFSASPTPRRAGYGFARRFIRRIPLLPALCLGLLLTLAAPVPAGAEDAASAAAGAALRRDLRPAPGEGSPAADSRNPAGPVISRGTNDSAGAGAAAGIVSAGSGGLDATGHAQWTELEPGLEFGEFRPASGGARLTALRLDPARFDFVLCASSADGKGPRTLDEWSRELDLVAAINASMYLPDGTTSTGYMRGGGHVNNGRLVERFGAFFVAAPREPNLASATIVDRDDPHWRDIIGRYDVVIQNYRMINDGRRILWSPGGPLYSISAIARDGAGRILFLHSRAPVEAYAFAQQLLHLPLDVRTTMYVEGGAQAGLLVRSASLRREVGSPHAPSLLVTGNFKVRLPNVLGVRRKAAMPDLPEGVPASPATGASPDSAVTAASAATTAPTPGD